MLYIILCILLLCSCAAEDTAPMPSTEAPRYTEAPAQTAIPSPSFSPLPTPSFSPSPPAEKDDNVLAEFKTSLLDKEKNRVNNIQLAAKKLDGCRVEAGKEFSFNRAVGERTAEKGYKEAAVLVGEEHTSGIGGGVCQVCTTLYNAAKKAGLEITDHHRHKTEVAYAPGGTDATVNYDNIDFKFKNNTDSDIEIKTKVNKNSVYVVLRKI